MLVLTLFVYGCTSTRMLDRTSEETYRELNKKFSDKSVQVQLTDGSSRKVKYVWATADSIAWIDKKTRIQVTLPATNIRCFSFRDHKKGLFQGMGIGLLIGLPVTFIVAASLGNRTKPLDSSEEALETLGILAPTIYGLFLGASLGAVVGSAQMYKLASPEEIQQQKSSKYWQPRTEVQSKNQ